jgi:hypothetical protein
VLPRKITQDMPPSERQCWRVIRLDTCKELPGEILAADCDTGVCTLKKADGAAQDYNLGPDSIVIVGR